MPQTTPKKLVPVLITGMVRGGTMYTARVLQAAGLAFAHEMPDHDGAVTGYIGGALHWDNAGIVIHQLRAPWTNIASFMNERPWVRSIPLQHIEAPPDHMTDPLERSCWIYANWHELALQRASWVFRVEELSSVWSELLERISRAWRPFPWQVSTKTNTRFGIYRAGYQELTPEHIKNCGFWGEKCLSIYKSLK